MLPLLCAENTVAGIAQTRNDIALFVQAFVHAAAVDVHVRMCCQQGILDDKEFAAKKAEIEKKKKADGKQT